MGQIPGDTTEQAATGETKMTYVHSQTHSCVLEELNVFMLETNNCINILREFELLNTMIIFMFQCFKEMRYFNVTVTFISFVYYVRTGDLQHIVLHETSYIFQFPDLFHFCY